MATKQAKFDAYRYYVYSNRYDSSEPAAHIYLYASGSLVAWLRFYYDVNLAKQVPYAPGTGGGFVRLYFHMSEFNRIIDMLRNEEPLYVAYDTEKQEGRLGTSQEEPVGEEE